jgi:hypothetical protein
LKDENSGKEENQMDKQFGDNVQFPRIEIPRGMGKKIAIVGIVVVVLIVLASVFVTVGAGQRGVLLRWTAVTDTIYEEGLHYKVPYMHDVARICRWSPPKSP